MHSRRKGLMLERTKPNGSGSSNGHSLAALHHRHAAVQRRCVGQLAAGVQRLHCHCWPLHRAQQHGRQAQCGCKAGATKPLLLLIRILVTAVADCCSWAPASPAPAAAGCRLFIL